MKIAFIPLLIFAFLVLPFFNGMAQYRSDLESSLHRTGHITRTLPHNDQQSFFGLQDFKMNHSYEMRVGSFGGNTYNMNTYTNTMHFVFSDNLYSRVDLAMSHSPFGSNMIGQNDTQFYIRNAEINYRFSENSRIQLRFQQLPAGYGYYGYDPYSPFSPHSGRNRHHHPYYW